MSQHHPHQSRGLRPKQVTIIRPRCPVTGELLARSSSIVLNNTDAKGGTTSRVSFSVAPRVTLEVIATLDRAIGRAGL